MSNGTSDPPTRPDNPPTPWYSAVIIIVAILLSLPVVTVVLRFYARSKYVKRLRKDDWLIALALACAITDTVCTTVVARNHGKFVVTPTAMRASLANALLYFPSVWSVKVSILYSCNNIFGRPVRSRASYVIYGGMAFITVHFLVSFFTVLFQCSPVTTSWNPTKFPQGCMQIGKLHVAHSIINAFTDVFVYALPLALVIRANLPSRSKSYLYCIFGLGLLVVVSSIGRILIFEMINRGKSMSHWKWIFVLTALEIDIAITLASLPYLGPLIRGCLPIPSGPGSWEPDILSENHPMQADDWLRGSSKSEGVAHCSKMEQGSESSTNNDIELDA